jgi:hypothetical protein
MGNVMTWACCRSGVCFILACTLQCVMKSRTSSCLEFVTSEFALKMEDRRTDCSGRFMVWNPFWSERFMLFYGLEPILTWTFYAILWSGINFDLNVLCHFMVWNPFWPERFMLFYGLQSILTWNVLCHFMVWNLFWPDHLCCFMTYRA